MAGRPFQYRFALVIMVASGVLLASSSYAQKSRKGHNHGRSFFSVSPNGISYGYQSRGFGINIGSGGLGIGPLFRPAPQHYHHEPAPSHAESHRSISQLPPGTMVESRVVSSTPTISSPTTDHRSGAPTAVDRSRVIESLTVPTNQAASKFKIRAETEFRVRNYKEARRYIDYALLEDNSNGHLLLFASHASVALEDYERAAIELNAATQRLHQNEWDFFVRNSEFWYPHDEYPKQLEKLDRFCDKERWDYGFIIRGFHLACDGQIELAEKDLQLAADMNPENKLVQRLQANLQLSRKSINTTTPPPSMNPSKIENLDEARVNILEAEPAEVLPPPAIQPPLRSVLEGKRE